MPIKTTTSFAVLENQSRPREKALRQGLKSLTDAELMAIVFGTGIKGKSVLELVQDILTDNQNHLSYITEMPPAQFMKRYKGIGPAKALTLLAGLELGIRSARDAASIPDKPITSSATAYDYMREKLEHLDHEEFWILLLTQAATPITPVFIASGGQTATIVDIRLIIGRALNHKAVRMILFHNHPSGNLQPSPQDNQLTKKIAEAARLIDIRVDDHIIISPKGYYSYNDHGLMM